MCARSRVCTSILVRPITDSAFTERILGMPNENYKGYVEADATQRARHIPSNSFFLLHGMADVTAPYLHGVQLAHSLTDAGIIFRYQVTFRRLHSLCLTHCAHPTLAHAVISIVQTYADEGHHLNNVIEHVYKSMEDYLKDCLSLDPDTTKNDGLVQH